jgi:hypothetical protein
MFLAKLNTRDAIDVKKTILINDLPLPSFQEVLDNWKKDTGIEDISPEALKKDFQSEKLK